VSESGPADQNGSVIHKSAGLARFIAINGLLFWFCALLLGGCWKSKPEPLSPSQVHAITREFAATASSSGPAGTSVWIANRASAKQPAAFDGVSVTIRVDTNGQAGRAALSRLVQALDKVAARHKLTPDPPREKGGVTRLVFRREDKVTHEIEIAGHSAKPSQEETAQEGAPLAIILDDLGNDRGAAEAIFSLPYPLTISVLPNHPHSVDIAEEAHRRGYEVLLHLPMQANGPEKPEAEELYPGMPSGQVARLVEGMVNAVPYAVGVNNHQGSQATSNAALMKELMPVLRERGLFYIDSRTAATTVAYDTAREDGVRTGFRNVPFLDDLAETGAVRKQLEIAMREARRKGGGIAIGHPHPATLQALKEMLPAAQKQGVRLVFASDLVH